ncbi:MAG: Ig-like domain-containing protein [Oscillospiraceae bacterium]|nr:Ig-like domain-containing protein [Oscillospiraceae bacterium]
MKKMPKRLLSALLTFCMVTAMFSALSTTAFADAVPVILLNGLEPNTTPYAGTVEVSVDIGTLTITKDGATFKTDVVGPVICDDPGVYVVTAVDAGIAADTVTFTIALVADSITVDASGLTELIYGTTITDKILSDANVKYTIGYTNGTYSNPIPVMASMCDQPISNTTYADIGQTKIVTVKYNDGNMNHAATFNIKIINKDLQTGFRFASAMSFITYGADAFTVTATGAATGSVVSYESSDTTVATVDSMTGTVTILKAGTTTITATAGETADYQAGTATYTLNVVKAALTVKPKDIRINVNAPLPTPEVDYVGLKYNDTAENLGIVTPTSGTFAMQIRNAEDNGVLDSTAVKDMYKIIFTDPPSFEALNNYDVSFDKGTLTIGDPPPSPSQTNNDSSSGSGSSGSSSSSSTGGGGIAGEAAIPVTQQEQWATTAIAESLVQEAVRNNQTLVRSSYNGTYGIRAGTWTALADKRFYHDTMDGNTVQVRISIVNPGQFTQDAMLSGFVKGANVESVTNTFTKWFNNTVRTISLDQQGAWEKPVQVAAKLDLSGMDTGNLYFYSYDRATNTYRRITAPAYRIDANGYLRFTTGLAGNIVISDGALARK